MKDRGFTLLEVLIALVILSLLVISVFHFFSNTLGYHHKIGRRYDLLRRVKTFISTFSPEETKGQQDYENLRIEWSSREVRKPKNVRLPGRQGGVHSRLIRVDLAVYRTGGTTELYTTTFLVNALSRVKK